MMEKLLTIIGHVIFVHIVLALISGAVWLVWSFFGIGELFSFLPAGLQAPAYGHVFGILWLFALWELYRAYPFADATDDDEK